LTPEEQRDGLDGELQTSIAQFDAMLAREQQKLEDKQARDPVPSRGGVAGGSGAGGSGDDDGEGSSGEKAEKGQKSGKRDGVGRGDRGGRKTAEKDPKTGDGEQAPQAGTDTATGGSQSGRGDGGTPVTAPVEGLPSGDDDGAPGVPPDVGDGRDDDVVARQLREAAMKEKDPAVREKLWQEYRDYKKGTGKD
jgi:hypothetical protein